MEEGTDTSYRGRRTALSPSIGVGNREDVKVMGSKVLGAKSAKFYYDIKL
jgi:hypothetical protein